MTCYKVKFHKCSVYLNVYDLIIGFRVLKHPKIVNSLFKFSFLFYLLDVLTIEKCVKNTDYKVFHIWGYFLYYAQIHDIYFFLEIFKSS